MKNFILITLLLVTLTSIHSQGKKSIDLNWVSNFEEAKKLATEQNKLLLIYFTGSDWSTPCKMLNEDFFYTEKFQKLASEHLILLRVNSPKRSDLISELQQSKNAVLSNLYNQRVFPTVVIADSRGGELGKIESYNYLHDTSKHYLLIKDAIEK